MNDRQLVISALFLGMVFGQFIYGPVSDAVGRKGPVAVGCLFMVGHWSLRLRIVSQRCCWDESCKASARQGRVS